MPIINYGGRQFALIPESKLTPGEVDAIERVTGLTFQKIRRMGQTCVCEHDIRAHSHKDDAGEQTDDTSCTECSCPQHEGDVPTRVSTAMVWVGIRRGDLTVKYADVAEVPMNELVTAEEADDEPDPTDQPQPEASPA